MLKRSQESFSTLLVGQLVADLLRRSQRHRRVSQRPVGAAARHRGRRTDDEQVLVVVGAAPGVDNTGGGIVSGATAASPMSWAVNAAAGVSAARARIA